MRDEARTESPDPVYRLNNLSNLMKIAFTRKLAMEALKKVKSEV